MIRTQRLWFGPDNNCVFYFEGEPPVFRLHAPGCGCRFRKHSSVETHSGDFVCLHSAPRVGGYSDVWPRTWRALSHEDTPTSVFVCSPEKRNRGAEDSLITSDVDVTARRSCPEVENERPSARSPCPQAEVLRARAVSAERSCAEVSPPISCQRRGAAPRVARRPAMTEAAPKMLKLRHCP